MFALLGCWDLFLIVLWFWCSLVLISYRLRQIYSQKNCSIHPLLYCYCMYLLSLTFPHYLLYQSINTPFFLLNNSSRSDVFNRVTIFNDIGDSFSSSMVFYLHFDYLRMNKRYYNHHQIDHCYHQWSNHSSPASISQIKTNSRIFLVSSIFRLHFLLQ